ncbi:MAG: hypothetical protein P857_639 [Candidatus Xenolissoclinum pacificiensis L6]|uniref:Uncharacterized protein n=1 Tax=Candidatus Xenolissoclinum pacificiensis L6 TaxID=1401685 RepID=W2V0G8_9RICK|nr:MAG: hypothetical protein P857_639 [Candidatus Xenolissoclinum pacificiensis L6]
MRRTEKEEKEEMKISYKKISKKPQVFVRLFGIKVERFSRILRKVQLIWKQGTERNKKTV